MAKQITRGDIPGTPLNPKRVQYYLLPFSPTFHVGYSSSTLIRVFSFPLFPTMLMAYSCWTFPRSSTTNLYPLSEPRSG